ncbi:MAG TPA: hypothetical protein VGR50_08005 [Terriglobales bacterium]|nr:hypothetical protein [Terriglobales bacterium]
MNGSPANSPPQFDPPDFSPKSAASRSEAPWIPIVFGAVFLAVLAGLVILMVSAKSKGNSEGPGPYASQLVLSDAKFSQAQNFVGAVVTYLDGAVANNGDKTLTSAEVEAVFKNSLGETVQQETQPLKVLRTSGPYPEALDLTFAPLAPHQHGQFRLTFEHISADWNQQLPALRIVSLRTK